MLSTLSSLSIDRVSEMSIKTLLITDTKERISGKLFLPILRILFTSKSSEVILSQKDFYDPHSLSINNNALVDLTERPDIASRTISCKAVSPN